MLLTVTGASGGEGADAAIAVQRLDTGERRVLLPGGAEAVYAATGDIVYLASGSLLAVPFDLGDAVPSRRSRGVWSSTSRPTPSAAAATPSPADGTLVYRGGGGRARPLLLVDRRGSATRIPAPDHTFIDPRVSPDGSRIAVQASDSGSDIWIYDLGRATLTRLSFDPQEDETPVWSPDGAWVAWVAQRSGRPRQVLRRRADGSGEEVVTGAPSAHAHVHDWSPDGKNLLVTRTPCRPPGTCGWSRSREARRGRCSRAPSRNGTRASRRTVVGSPMPPTRRASSRSTCAASRSWTTRCRFRKAAATAGVDLGRTGARVPQRGWPRGGRSLHRGAGPHPVLSRPQALFADVYGAAVGRMSHPDYDAFPDGSRFLMLGNQQDGGLRRAERRPQLVRGAREARAKAVARMPAPAPVRSRGSHPEPR